MSAIFVDYLDFLPENLLKNSKTYYNNIENILANIESTIITFIVPISKTFSCLGGSSSANTDTIFRFYIDDVLKETKKTNWCGRNTNFSVIERVNQGKIIRITAEHKSSKLQNFESSIFGILLDG